MTDRQAALATLAMLTGLGCVLLSGSNALGQTSAETAPLARLLGRDVLASEIEALTKDRLARVRAEEYAIKRQVLEEYIQSTLLEREAASRGVSIADLQKQEIDGKVMPVTDVQLRAIYETSNQYQGKPETEAFPQIEKNLKAIRLAEARRKFLAALREKAGVVILLQPPRSKVSTEGDPARGSRNATVTLVEFSDFQCPYCKQGATVVKQVLAKYGDRVRFVYRDFPLEIHPEANKAAEAGECAAEQGKFWEMHDKLFENPNALKVPDLKRAAATVGLDMARFNQCLDTGKYASEIEADHAEGARLGVTGTPTFFVNGRMTVGANYAKLAALIDEELATAAAKAQQSILGTTK